MYSISIFFILHFTYMGGAYAPNAPACLPTDLLSLYEVGLVIYVHSFLLLL